MCESAEPYIPAGGAEDSLVLAARRDVHATSYCQADLTEMSNMFRQEMTMARERPRPGCPRQDITIADTLHR